MSEYTQQILKVTVAQLCQTIGWNSIQSTPLELMSDILNKYIKEIAHQTHRYSELYGRTEPNLDDVALAFKDMNVNIADLEEYVNNVDPVPCAVDVPKFPVQKENHLNFLKPGSKEVVTRPVHVHEYLPPMFPEREDEEKSSEILDANAEPNVEVVSLHGDDNEFSRKNDSHDQKHTRPTEAETRYTREITSVMMTTSGFISPAREGKLPDAKAPIIPSFDVEKVSVKEPPSAAVGSLISGSVNGTAVKSEKVKTEKIKSEKVKTKKKSMTAALIQEKKRKKEKQSIKDNTQAKVTPMGPPPAKQMPPLASTIYLPNDSPMSAVVEQQKIGKKPFMPKIPKKHKVKDPNKPTKAVLEGRISKKPKKPPKTPKNFSNMLDELFKVHQPTFPLAMPQNIPVDLKHEKGDVPIDLTDQPNMQQNQPPIVHQTQEQLPPFNAALNQPPNFMFEGKLSTEPDKRKLNIIKRISSKNKDDIGKQGLPLPPHINLPETSIFPIDDIGMSITPAHSPALPTHLLVPPKKTPKKSPTISAKKLMKLANEMPINMTVPKPGENIEFPIGLSPKQLKAAARKQMKALKEPKEKKIRVKKEKLKAKDKKLKEQPWSMNAATDLSITGPSPMIPTPTMPQRKSDPIPPMLQNIYDQQFTQFANQLRGNMGNIGNLRGTDFMQNFPMYPWSGPGLIPGNPLFSHFPLQPRQRLPFPLPNFEMFGTFPRLKRPHIDKPEPEPMAMPINIEMAQCNVAPLVPASMKLEASLKLEDITTPTPTMVHQNNYFSPTKAAFPSGTGSTSISLTPVVHGHQSTKPLTPEPKIDNHSTIDLTDDQYDDEITPPIAPKRVESPPLTTVPMVENSNQMSHVQSSIQSNKQRRLSSSPGHVVSSYNAEDTQSLTDSFVDDMDSGSNATNKDKSLKSEKRRDKEHKKEKKDKEGKIKKKKDKKDKIKNKEKSEKRKEKEDKHKEKEDKHKEKELKIKTKKEKKEKKKEKELARVLCGMATTPPTSGLMNDVGISSPGSGRDSDSSVVPKLTLKLGTSPRPETPDSHRKITIKPVKKELNNLDMDNDDHSISLQDSDQSREPSPELARFSALVTRPPKQKTPLQNESRPYTPSYPRTKRDSFNYESDEESTNILKEDYSVLPAQHLPSPVYLSRPKTPQLQQQKSPVPLQQHAFTSVVPTVTSFPTDTVVVPSAIQTQSRQSSYIDSDGNQVWICPACGRVDDGTPMIGCDGCDAWYHWVCVGIQVPPDANEDWYCRVCIAKKQELQGGDKKKKRKKKDKKEH